MGSEDKTSRDEKEIICESIKEIESLVPKKEKILLCICGDLIDSAKLGAADAAEVKNRYLIADDILQMIRGKLAKEYTLTIKFCLGNHDVTHINDFCKCVSAFDPAVGKDDYENLEALLRPLPEDANKILVLHHTIMSMDENDSSSIRDAARLIGIINRNNIVGILHGHIHGRDILTIGNNQCKVIGTGALFSRKHTDVNSQFNLIYFERGFFRYIYDCRFIADSRNQEENWDTVNIGGINCENYFRGNSFEKVYKDLLNKLAVCSPLYDTVLQVNCEIA